MPKYLITFGILLLMLSSASAQDTLVNDTDLSLMLQEYIVEDEPGMVIYVNDNGETATAVFGAADLTTDDAIRAGDLFRIGSTTKPMVATVILTLVDEGEIELDDPIADYLPEDIVENVANAETATVRQMLQMTSGIFNYTDSDAFDDAFQQDPQYPWTAAETLTYIYGEAPYFEPGEDYYYSNSNYNLAEIIIEEVTGLSLAEALEDIVFAPTGMDDCYLEIPTVFAENIVRGYMLDEDDEYLDITEENDGVGMGDGGVVCTAEDLAKFLPALMAGELISDEMLDEMLTTVDDGEGGQYGLGIGYDDSEYGMIVSHDGATSGFQSVMLYLEDEGISIAIVTNNFDSEVVEDVALDAIAIAFGEY